MDELFKTVQYQMPYEDLTVISNLIKLNRYFKKQGVIFQPKENAAY